MAAASSFSGIQIEKDFIWQSTILPGNAVYHLLYGNVYGIGQKRSHFEAAGN